MFNILQGLGIGLGTVVTTIIGAIVGGLIKWFFDRKLIKELTIDREEARREQKDAFNELDMRKNEIFEKEIRIRELERRVNSENIELELDKAKLDNLLAALRNNERGLWTTHSKKLPFEDFEARIARLRPIVITVANLKGGVGKTTLVGNLVAYFDKELGKRVLAVDLDYQGSLSTMLRAEQLGPIQGRISKVNALLSAGDPLERLWSAIRPLGERLPRSELSSAFYDLALFEDALLVEWLIQRCDDDVRYRLASVLHHPKVAERYDVVLIDVPPRMTTGTINALCASTHVLVPTIFAPLSAEPVENFLLTAKGLMNHLNPKLQFLGVVETMTPPSNVAVDVREQGRELILRALQNMSPAMSILDCDIPRRAALADGVGYLKNGREGSDARQTFNGLGDEIMRRI